MKKVLIAGAVGTAVLFGTLSAGIPGLPAADTQVAKAATQLPKGIGGRAVLAPFSQLKSSFPTP